MKHVNVARRPSQKGSGALSYVAAAVPFVATLAVGAMVTAVASLFVYANVADVKSRDDLFGLAGVFGLAVSGIIAFMNARGSIAADLSASIDAELGLLKKYRRKAGAPGADGHAGQRRIGDRYLRDLMRKRGA